MLQSWGHGVLLHKAAWRVTQVSCFVVLERGGGEGGKLCVLLHMAAGGRMWVGRRVVLKGDSLAPFQWGLSAAAGG